MVHIFWSSINSDEKVIKNDSALCPKRLKTCIANADILHPAKACIMHTASSGWSIYESTIAPKKVMDRFTHWRWSNLVTSGVQLQYTVMVNYDNSNFVNLLEPPYRINLYINFVDALLKLDQSPPRYLHNKFQSFPTGGSTQPSENLDPPGW